MHRRMRSECREGGALALSAAPFVLPGLGAVTCMIPSRRAARWNSATQLET
jgi:hypothetical protein